MSTRSLTSKKRKPAVLVPRHKNPFIMVDVLLAQKHAARLVEELQGKGIPLASAIGYATSLQTVWVRQV